ncbi:enoyl-CoA hydratase/isomerase family protein [Halobacteriales archaeon Cl-PHB]
MREYDSLDVSIEDDVFRIAFDEPRTRNAATPKTHEELQDVFDDAEDSEARVIVLTGEGDAFNAGADLNYLQETIDEGNPAAFYDMVRNDLKILRPMLDITKPVVARVNGDAMGQGATLALFCDIVVASEDARIGDTHVRAGLPAGDGSAALWPLLMSLNTAKELTMTGEVLSAEEAADLGMVNHVVPDDDLDAKVDEIVDDLASGPQYAIRGTKHVMNGWLRFGITTMLHDGLAMEALAMESDDFEEAIDAFMNKREPEFQ